MMPLPPEPFELSEWKMATVQMNYHIQVNKMNYSVPYEYVLNAKLNKKKNKENSQNKRKSLIKVNE